VFVLEICFAIAAIKLYRVITVSATSFEILNVRIGTLRLHKIALLRWVN
jgi:hypothetical protein